MERFRRSSRPEFRDYWPLCCFLLLTALLLLLPDAVTTLRYERTSVQQGEWWRLVSANLVHGNGWHWLLNAASASFQFWLFQGIGNRRWWWAVSLICLPANVLGMHWFSPGVSWYVGMSGALYGTAVFGGLLLLANREWLIGGVLSVYLLAELITIPVAVDAHLWGLVTGYVVAAAFLSLRSLRR